MSEAEGYWDIILTSLQDICNVNEATSFDNKYKKFISQSVGENDNDLDNLRNEIMEHKSNVATAKRLVNTSRKNLQTLIDKLSVASAGSTTAGAADSSKTSKVGGGKFISKIPKQTSKGGSGTVSSKVTKRGSGKSTGGSAKDIGANKKGNKKAGRSYYTSVFNPSDPIYVGSEVAYKLKNRHSEEWIQCEVMRVIGDGIKFEIRDPEPDENNNVSQTFKANYKEILLIPRIDEVSELVNYTYGSKVLARYPETTTFYTAVVVGNKKDGKVRLKFDGEDEVNKETEVERRLVLPFPEK